MGAADPLIGQRIEKCRIARLIGRGGYGLSYLAYDEELREFRVIKVSQGLTMGDSATSRLLQAFIEEGLILSRLKHPQIVTLRAQGDFEGRRYMVLDFIDGLSMRQIFEALKKEQEEKQCTWHEVLNPLTATALIASALEPLAYAHTARVRMPNHDVFGVAHRDISPGNLILGAHGNETGKVVLIDFGTAKTDLSEVVTLNPNLIGTIPYMSKPRLQRAQSVDQAAPHQAFWKEYRETRNDIHAMAVLYFQCLTGRLPFRGESAPEFLVSILDKDRYPLILTEVRASFAAATEIIARALVWQDFTKPIGEQNYQYPDAAAMLKEIRALYQDLSNEVSIESRLNQLIEDHYQQPNLEIASVTESAHNALPITIAPAPSAPQIEPLPSYLPNQPTAFKLNWAMVGLALALALVTIMGAIWFKPWSTTSSIKSEQPLGALETLDAIALNADRDFDNDSNSNTTEKGPLKPKAKTSPSVKTKSASNSVILSKPNASASLTTVTLPAQKKDMSLSQSPAGQPLTGEEFLMLQSRVRAREVGTELYLRKAYDRSPQSADVAYLWALWRMNKGEIGSDLKQFLIALKGKSPQFVDSRLYHENTLYWIWQYQQKVYTALQNKESRIQLINAANIYLGAFGENPLYSAKIADVQASLSQW